jgi:hypothetical protein
MSETTTPGATHRRWRVVAWFNKDRLGITSAAVGTLVTAVVGGALTWQLHLVKNAVTDEPPSCTNPLDLQQLDARDLVSEGHWYYENDPFLRAKDPSDAKDFQDLRPSRAVDGNTNTLWVPPPGEGTKAGLFVPKPGEATLTLNFKGAHDVRLICIVNGYASEAARYRNWGRARTIRTVTDEGAATTVLASQGDCCFQNSQELRLEEGDTEGIALTMVNAYAGQFVFTQDGDFCDRETENDSGNSVDPDDYRDPDDRWELAITPGCYLGAQGKAGIAEVMVYTEPPGCKEIWGFVPWTQRCTTPEVQDSRFHYQPPAAALQPTSAPQKKPPLPADQARFLKTVRTAQQAGDTANNDLHRFELKSARDKALCDQMTSRSVKNWQGRLGSVAADQSGIGVLEVEFGAAVSVGTWNDQRSDRHDETMIEPGSSVFTSAVGIKEGSRVIFSGSFVAGGEAKCFRDNPDSLTSQLRSPTFVFKFDAIAPMP